jgi:hypothetical protein
LLCWEIAPFLPPRSYEIEDHASSILEAKLLYAG